ncbi:MAG: aminoglycoside phosphotransferase family protein [Candidatus Pacearchaeota archaeon]|nr:aminoglycoside phosphotransferase family protein [Candidatus Pacearchaeota archaeon]
MKDKAKEILEKEYNAKVLEIKETEGGFSHPMYLAEINKEPFSVLIRFSNLSQKKKWDLRKEVWVLKKLAEAGIPVPRVYSFYKNESENEHDYMTLEKLKGTRLDKIWDNLSSEEKKIIAKKIGKLIKKIHSIKLGKFGRLEENGEIDTDKSFQFKTDGDKKPHNQYIREFLIRTLKDFARLIGFEHLDHKKIARWTKFIIENKELYDYKDQPTLIHGDMHLGHLFVEKINGEYEITGVIDVEFAEPEHPEYDFIKLHRQGFFNNSELLNSLKEGYGEINEKLVEFFRISRDIGFTQVLLESGANEKAEEVIEDIDKRIDNFKK